MHKNKAYSYIHQKKQVFSIYKFKLFIEIPI